MSLPILLSVAVGGILLVIVLVYFVWGTTSAHVGDEVALAARLQREYPGHELDDILFSTDGQVALAQDTTDGDLLLFYAHGIHVNIRKCSHAGLQSCRLMESQDGALTMRLELNAFDRDLFVLILPKDEEIIAQAHAWEKRLGQESR